MKPYFSVLRVRFLNGLQYRAAALGGLMTQFFWGLMLVFLYHAFYSNGTRTPVMEFSQLVSYIWLQQAFYALLVLFYYDYELFDLITSGGISYELCRPIHLYGFWYVKLLSRRLANALLRFPLILLIAFLMPKPYKISLPKSPLSFLLFLVTMGLGVLLLVCISMFIYITTFKTLSPTGSLALIGITGEFFSGLTLPIPMMPQWLQTVCYCLPFRWTADLPLRVYSGSIGTNEALVSIVIQLLWIAVLAGIGSYILKRITRKVVIQGG